MNFVAAPLYAVSTSVLLAIAFAFLRGGLDLTGARLALDGGLLVAAISLWQGRNVRVASHRPRPWEWVAIVVFAIASARAFLWLVFVDGDAIKVLSPNNLGDLSLHISYIRNFAGGAPFWPENPIFAHGPLAYPVGVDLFNALLAVLGVDVLRGLIWVALAGAALTGAALWKWGRGVALAAFLGNGGLAGFAILSTWTLVDFQTELAWKNFFLSIFVTQRGMLFALPAGLLLLANWRTRFFSADPDGWRLPLWGEVLLYASMPVFHLHTFIFLSLMLGSWFVLQAQARAALLRLVALAFVPATALTFLVTGKLRGASVIGWKPGWMWDDATWLKWCETNLPGTPEFNAMVLFWPMNFGVLILLVAWMAWRLITGRRTGWTPALFFPALFIFLLCCVVKFAPWEWDNTKIMIWSYLAIVPIAWQELLAARPLWMRSIAFVLLFGSGFLSLFGGLDGRHRGFDLGLRSELDGVAKAVRGIPVAERFAAYPTYNHPLLLVGRKVALGYPGHAWSHGIDYRSVEAQVVALMNGDDGWRETARELGVRYVFWGTEEAENYKDSREPWRTEAKVIASGAWGTIYDLAAAP
jgi:hypothetical protein